jgi:toxin-antitoxin system PIN domain toxin
MSPEPAAPELTLLDTNVLVYAIYEDAPQHAASRRTLERCGRGEQPLAITQQILAEFYSTVTSPRRVTSPYTPNDAIALLRQILAIPNLAVLPVPPDVHERWLTLLEANPVGGRKCFDVQLAAAMLGCGLRRIFTYNTADFTGFSGIEAVLP